MEQRQIICFIYKIQTESNILLCQAKYYNYVRLCRHAQCNPRCFNELYMGTPLKYKSSWIVNLNKYIYVRQVPVIYLKIFKVISKKKKTRNKIPQFNYLYIFSIYSCFSAMISLFFVHRDQTDNILPSFAVPVDLSKLQRIY
jgi:hypothetical protein